MIDTGLNPVVTVELTARLADNLGTTNKVWGCKGGSNNVDLRGIAKGLINTVSAGGIRWAVRGEQTFLRTVREAFSAAARPGGRVTMTLKVMIGDCEVKSWTNWSDSATEHVRQQAANMIHPLALEAKHWLNLNDEQMNPQLSKQDTNA